MDIPCRLWDEVLPAAQSPPVFSNLHIHGGGSCTAPKSGKSMRKDALLTCCQVRVREAAGERTTNLGDDPEGVGTPCVLEAIADGRY
ncbi:hypothetical protein LX36DRAFT_650679 [Colletotrichum falcatum]|nr:hypothetical protein LX36DRAFT_650679 [Colletotrichum falcatum]